MVFKVKPAKCRSSLTHRVAIKRKRLHFERLEERRVLAAGDVDLTFGTQGFATAEFYESRTWGDMLTAVALQPDGKLVAAGGGTAVRYMADGTLDDTFGIGGRLPIPMDARAIALQADGKIWLAGGTDDALSRDFVLARLMPSGSLDASFADKGLQRVDFGSNEEMAHAMVLDSAGRILLAGGSGKRVALTRLRDNGSLDSTFSQHGLFTTQFSLQDVAYAIALQASGRIVVAGSSFISSTTTPLITTNYDAFVMKLFPSGALDNSFGGDGIVQTDFVPSAVSIDEPRDIAIQSNGQIVISGQAYGFGDTHVATARYNLDGSLDSTFGNQGIRTDLTPDAPDAARSIGSLVIRRDGRMVVTSRDRVWQYTAAGQPDASFGEGGSVASGGLVATSLELANHALIIGGTFDGLMGLRKLRADGSADTSFDVDGVVTLETGPSREIVEDSLVTPDGKIIVVGSSRHGFFIARYTSQGRLDNTFSGDGKQLVFFDNRYFDAVAKSVALAPDGKIVVGGYVKRMSLNVVDSDFAVVRLLANGALDLTFSYDGRQTTNLGGMDYGYVVTVLPDKKIILAGEATTKRAAVVRYRADGQLDRDFSGDGITVLNRMNSSLHTLSVLPDGRLLAAGEIWITDAPHVRYKTSLMLTRLNADGSLDQTFGVPSLGYRGIIIYAASTVRNALDMAINSDGSIFIAGDYPDINRLEMWSNMAVVKLRPDGLIDGSFGTRAAPVPWPTPTSSLAKTPSTASSLVLQSDGKILLMGSAAGNMVVARFNVIGTIDTSFAGDGFALLKPAGDSVAGVRVRLQRDGRIIAVGTATATRNGDRDILVTRLFSG